MILAVLFFFLQISPHFQAGNDALKIRDYKKAVAKYQQIPEEDRSPEIYFNLASAYLELENLGEAAYHFEKAGSLSNTSNYNEFQRRLNLALAKRNGESSTSTVLSLPRGLIYILILVVLGVLMWQLPLQKKPLAILAALFIGAFFTFQMLKPEDENATTAIVIADVMTCYEDPTEQGTVTGNLVAGSKIEILDTLGEWRKIRMPNATSSWMLAEGIRVVE